MKKKLFVLSILMVLVMLITACAVPAEEPAPAEEEAAPAEEEAAPAEKEKMCISFAFVDIPAVKYIADQYVEQGEAAGYEVTLLSAEGDVEKQVADVETLLQGGCDFFVHFPVTSDAGKPAIDAVREAGVPLVYFSYAIKGTEEGTDYLAIATGVNTEQGAKAADWIDESWEDYGFSGDKKYIMLAGPVGQGAADDRGKGFVERAAELGFVEVAAQTANWSRSEAKDVITNLIQSTGGDFNVIYSQNEEMIFGAIAAMKEAGIDPATVMTIGIDATFEVADAVKAGELGGVVYYNLAELATGAYDTFAKFKAGEDFPVITGLTLDVIDKSNVEQYLDEGKILF